MLVPFVVRFLKCCSRIVARFYLEVKHCFTLFDIYLIELVWFLLGKKRGLNSPQGVTRFKSSLVWVSVARSVVTEYAS